MGGYAAVSPALLPTIQPNQSFDNKNLLPFIDERFSRFTFYFSFTRLNKIPPTTITEPINARINP